MGSRWARPLRWIAKLVLVLVTLVCLASIGGAMLFAFPVLVPLHWLAARGSGPVAVGGWALLAGLSVFEAGWMLAYLVTDASGASVALGALAGGGVTVLFLVQAATRASARPATA